MNQLDILSTLVSRAQESLADPEQRDAGERAITLIHSAAASGREVTLNARQVRVLSRLMHGAQASREVRRLSAPSDNIIPFQPAS